jgi:hypothetical protein
MKKNPFPQRQGTGGTGRPAGAGGNAGAGENTASGGNIGTGGTGATGVTGTNQQGSAQYQRPTRCRRTGWPGRLFRQVVNQGKNLLLFG